MLTIGYCYYNNHPEFQWVIDYYNNETWNDFNFCVVDDGSSVELPKCDWTKIRIDHDYELWNNEGARNVMADFLDTGWILFMDVDFVLKDKEDDKTVREKIANIIVAMLNMIKREKDLINLNSKTK